MQLTSAAIVVAGLVAQQATATVCHSHHV